MWMMLVVFIGLWLWPGVSEAALCPTASVSTVCVDLTEPTGVLNLKDTQVTLSKNGSALPVVTLPASAATGGGTVNTSISTVACESADYSASVVARYQTALGVFNSLAVLSTPPTITKDRTTEAACLKPPTNFSIH